MALPSPFSLPQSQFNAFLFASIGNEGNGMVLSVISALARLGVDPWQEAARLADLPKELAAAALDRLILRLPAGLWERTDTPEIAARLIELLPRRDAIVRPAAAASVNATKANPPFAVWLIVLALGASALVGSIANRIQQADGHGASGPISTSVRSSTPP